MEVSKMKTWNYVPVSAILSPMYVSATIIVL
jgi:hypothetical protein